MRRWVALAVIVLVAALGATAAWSWFSAPGSGTSGATVGALAAPGAPTVPGSTSGGNVTLEWNGVASPAGGPAVAYWVQRHEGATSADVCGTTAAAPLFAGTGPKTCTDTSVPAGTYSYTVTSVWRTFTASSDPVGVALAGPPVPVLTSTPPASYPSKQATFAFNTAGGPISGLTFECSLDGAAFATCTSPTTYTGLADGPHTFAVHSELAAAESADATHTWSVVPDPTPPTVALILPVDGSAYSTSTWIGGVRVSSSDPGPVSGGLADVRVSIRQGTGSYWDGAAFASASEVLLNTSFIFTNTWLLPFPAASFPTDTDYTVRAVATDRYGNTAATPSRTFAVDQHQPIVTVTQVDGVDRTFPYTRNAPVASIGGTCGTVAGDLPTVTVTITGNGGQTATAPCTSGTWTAVLATPIGTVGTSTVTAQQSDAAGVGTSPARAIVSNPRLRVTGPPALNLSTTATFTFDAGGPGFTWGQGTSGQLGNGTSALATVPVSVVQGAMPAGVQLLQVAAGGGHTVALGYDGKVYSWGRNTEGQLGNGTMTGSNTPVALAQGAVPVGLTFTQVAAGADFSLALGTDGKAYAWGTNSFGQLGDGVQSNLRRSTPAPVVQGALPAGVRFTQLATGQNHTIAVGSNGKAYAWGNGPFGRLGNGSDAPSYVPVAVSQGAVPAGVTFTQVGAGNVSSLALGSNGRAYAWGANQSGQRGDGTMVPLGAPDTKVPVEVLQGTIPAGVTLTQITGGGQHTVALGSDGKAYTWGAGPLGSGVGNQRSVPGPVSAGAVPAGVTFTQVSAGMDHSTALGSNGRAYAWGEDSQGQLGNVATGFQTVPVAVDQGATTFTGLGLGPFSFHTAVVGVGPALPRECSVDGGPFTPCTSPVSYSGLGLGTHTLTVRTDATSADDVTTTWENVADTTPPTVGITFPAAGGAYLSSQWTAAGGISGTAGDPGAVSTGVADVQLSIRQGSGSYWNGSSFGSASEVLLDVAGVATWSFAFPTTSFPVSGSYTVRAVVTDGAGNATSVSRTFSIDPAPPVVGIVEVNGLNRTFPYTSNTPITSVGGSCGVLSGDLPTVNVTITGNGAQTTTAPCSAGIWTATLSTPIAVNGISTVGATQQDAAGHTGVAVNRTVSYVKALEVAGPPATTTSRTATFTWDALVGSGRGFGHNLWGQVGVGNTAPQPLSQATGVFPGGRRVQVAVGTDRSIGLGTDGRAYAWGQNFTSSPLGVGTTTDPVVSPTVVVQGAVPVGVLFVQVAAGNGYQMALTSQGKAYAWGNNSLGQLGTGGPVSTNVPAAVAQGAVPAGVTLTQIAAGDDHSLALGSDGKVYAWGTNDQGQLGNGTTTPSTTPVAVSAGAVPAGVTITRIAAGVDHSMALGSDGKVYTWGLGTSGQLGNSGTASSSTPVAVATGAIPAGVTVTAIAAGGTHDVAIGSDGEAYAWGEGTSGRLGNGGTASSSTPVLVSQGQVPAGVTFTQVAAGLNHTIVLGSNLRPYTWGSNAFGQLGDGTSTSRSTPIATNTLSVWSSIGAGATANHVQGVGTPPHTCSLDGAAFTTCASPTTLTGLTAGPHTFTIRPEAPDELTHTWTVIADPTPPTVAVAFPSASGAYSRVAWDAAAPIAGTAGDAGAITSGVANVKVSVRQGSGSYWNGTAFASATEVLVTATGTDTWSLPFPSSGFVADGEYTVRAVSSDGWDNTATQSRTFLIDDAAPAVAITQVNGGTRTFPFTSSLAVTSVGGTCGSAAGDLSTVNVAITGNAAQTAVGTCAGGTWTATLAPPITASGSSVVAAVQLDTLGHVGAATSQTIVANRSLQLTGPPATTSSASAAFTFGALGGPSQGWGNGSNGQSGGGATGNRLLPGATANGALPAGVRIVQGAVSQFHTVVLGSNGQLYSYGAGGNGRLGDGNTTGSNLPVAVVQGALPAGVTIVQVAAGGSHNVALGSDGRAYTWGLGTSGEMGNGTLVGSNTMVQVVQGAVPAGVRFVQVTAGNAFSVALGSDGKAYSWGVGSNGRLGNGGTGVQSSPVAVSQGAAPVGVTFIKVAAGSGFGIALGTNGKAYTWGNGASGQLGNGGIATSNVPVAVSQGAVPAGVTFTQVSAGNAHALVAGSDGKAYSWGLGTDGRLGNNGVADSNVPVAVSAGSVPGGVTLTQVSAGASHSAALGSDGKAYTWGLGSSGQLGNNGTASSSVPVAATSGATTYTSLAVGPLANHLIAVTVPVGLTYQCSLDGAAFATCTSPQNLSGLGVGTHTFAVRVLFNAITSDDTTYTWTRT